MKNWVKIVLPIVAVAYCMAFMEVDLQGGTHQTWNDPYDSYIISQHNNDTQAENLSVNLGFQNAAITVSNFTPNLFTVFVFIFIPFFIVLYNSSGLYRKNCTFLL